MVHEAKKTKFGVLISKHMLLDLEKAHLMLKLGKNNVMVKTHLGELCSHGKGSKM